MVNGILDDRRGEGGRKRRRGMGIGGRSREREREILGGLPGRQPFLPSIQPALRSALPPLPPHERFQYPVMSVAQCTHC